MTWDPVPWFVEGGAEHSPNVARLLSYAAFGGNEGVIGATDLEVKPLTTPGASIRVMPGACSIKNSATGVTYEMYVGRLPSIDTVAIAPTGAGAGRSDMIVALVKNPWLAGEPWPDPVDEKVGPYIVTQVISGVSGTATKVSQVEPGWSAIPLARIDIPTSTSTITADMITDLRSIAQPRSSRELFVASPGHVDDLTSTTFANFPTGTGVVLNATVPSWATHAKIVAMLGGVAFGATGTNGGAGWGVVGELRIQFGGGDTVHYSQVTGYNLSNEGGWDRTTLMCGAPSVPIPTENRGKTTAIRIEGKKISGSTKLRSDEGTTLTIDIEYVQKPESA